MIRILLFVFPFACTFASLPQEFSITEQVFALSATFDIACGDVSMGSASKHFFALSPTYDLEDSESKPLATARARFFSWGTVVDIEDPDGKALGRIEENLWKIFPWAEYKVYDAANREIMLATMDFWGTEFTLRSPLEPERVFATITRPFFRFFRDYWTVQIRDNSIFESADLDPRVLILLAVYQTDKDNRARFFSEYKDQLYKEFEQYDGDGFR